MLTVATLLAACGGRASQLGAPSGAVTTSGGSTSGAVASGIPGASGSFAPLDAGDAGLATCIATADSTGRAECTYVLASRQNDPDYIVVDTKNAYWNTSDEKIMEVGIEGGNTSVLTAGGGPIALNGGYLYFFNAPVPSRTPTDAGLPAAFGLSGGIAISNQNAYYIELTCEASGDVYKYDFTTATDTDFVMCAFASLTPPAIAIDSTGVYWGSPGGGFTSDGANEFVTGGILKFALVDGGFAGTLAGAQMGTQDTVPASSDAQAAPAPLIGFNPYALTVDSSGVYWTDQGAGVGGDAGSVITVGLDGGATTILASGQNAPQGIATDGANVYWTTSDGNVMKVAETGGAPIVLASGQANPHWIAVDATSVYWTNQGTGLLGQYKDGSVMKITPK